MPWWFITSFTWVGRRKDLVAPTSRRLKSLSATQGRGLSRALFVVFFVVSAIFVWRSFYGMRIQVGAPVPAPAHGSAVAGGK